VLVFFQNIKPNRFWKPVRFFINQAFAVFSLLFSFRFLKRILPRSTK
jgi:hypothetical protein